MFGNFDFNDLKISANYCKKLEPKLDRAMNRAQGMPYLMPYALFIALFNRGNPCRSWLHAYRH
jgi:hypothetical protein